MASDDSYNALLSALSPDLAGTLGSYADVSFASSLEVSRSTAPGGDASLMDDEVAETADGDESVEHGAETPVTSPVRPPLPRRGAGAGEERHAGRPESSRVRPADPKPPTPEPRPRSAREVHSGDQRRITPSFSALDPDMEELSARLDELAEVLKHGVLERYRRAKTAQLRARQLELAEAQAAHDAVLLAKQNEHEALKEAFGALQRRTQLLDAAATALRSRVVVHMVQQVRNEGWGKVGLSPTGLNPPRGCQRIMFKGPQSALRCLTAWREHTAFQARKRTTAVRLQQRQQLVRRMTDARALRGASLPSPTPSIALSHPHPRSSGSPTAGVPCLAAAGDAGAQGRGGCVLEGQGQGGWRAGDAAV